LTSADERGYTLVDMTNEELEKKVKELEKELRSFKSGSNNPHILISLNELVIELRDKQKKIIKVLKKFSSVLEKLGS
jgi:hypothetical protein